MACTSQPYNVQEVERHESTIRTNRRDFPTALADVAIEKGEAKLVMSDNSVLAVKFRSHQDKSGKKTKLCTC